MKGFAFICLCHFLSFSINIQLIQNKMFLKTEFKNEIKAKNESSIKREEGRDQK